MRTRYRRLLAGLVASTVVGTLLPPMVFVTPAAAADSGGSGGGDTSVLDDVKGWFADEEEPESANAMEISSREKLPKGAKAPKPKRVKELKNRRTPSARFFALSDGRVEAELTAVPTAYRDGKDKTWKPIDVSVRETSKKGFDYSNTANIGRTYFGSTPGELVRIEGEGGKSVTLGLDAGASPGGKGPKPVAKGAKVTYPNAVEGADLEYVVEPGQVKENIVLAERPDGAVKFSFTLDAGGLTPKSRKDGSIALYGEGPQTPVMVIPAPYMTDAVKDPASPTGGTYSTEVTQKLTKDGDNWKITVTPDTEWLADKDRRYPVVIDPTITIAPDAAGSKDTMVLSDQPSTNFNTTWKLSAGKTDVGIARALVEFPLSEIPAGVKVDSARLGVYFDQSHTTNANDVTIGAYRATGTWTEAGATWANTSGLVGELSGTTAQIDDGDAGTAAVGEWPRVTTTSTQNIGSDYAYNKNAATGESYTYQPQIPETASYRVEAHYSPLADNTTAAPYKVMHDGLTHNYTVDQTTGTTPTWKALTTTQLDFNKGNADKIVLGDTGDSTKRTMADAVRLVNPASIVKNTGEYNQWHNFPVTDTVQKWVSGTATNHGFVLKATDESATAPIGGPRYEAADGSTYGGERDHPAADRHVRQGRHLAELAGGRALHRSRTELARLQERQRGQQARHRRVPAAPVDPAGVHAVVRHPGGADRQDRDRVHRHHRHTVPERGRNTRDRAVVLLPDRGQDDRRTGARLTHAHRRHPQAGPHHAAGPGHRRRHRHHALLPAAHHQPGHHPVLRGRPEVAEHR